jgi:hypothetical protein
MPRKGKTDYPVMFLPYDKQGKELPTLQRLLQLAKTTLGAQFPDLLPLVHPDHQRRVRRLPRPGRPSDGGLL